MDNFAVIRFLEDDSFSEIPRSWICSNNNECWWPKSKNVPHLMAKNVNPETNWEKYAIEVITFCCKFSHENICEKCFIIYSFHYVRDICCVSNSLPLRFAL